MSLFFVDLESKKKLLAVCKGLHKMEISIK